MQRHVAGTLLIMGTFCTLSRVDRFAVGRKHRLLFLGSVIAGRCPCAPRETEFLDFLSIGGFRGYGLPLKATVASKTRHASTNAGSVLGVHDQGGAERNAVLRRK